MGGLGAPLVLFLLLPLMVEAFLYHLTLLERSTSLLNEEALKAKGMAGREGLLIKHLVIFSTGQGKVYRLEVSIVNLGPISYFVQAFPAWDLLLRYTKRVEGKGDGGTSLEVAALRVPFEPSCSPSNTCWSLAQGRKALEPDLLNPYSENPLAGALDEREVMHIEVHFSKRDEPYLNPRKGEGFLTLVLVTPQGLRVEMSALYDRVVLDE